MNFRHLRYFVAVAEELHFGRAAARVRIAQPPLSRQIKDLENELGVRLFDRNRQGVALTAAGGVFLGEVRQVLEQLEHAAATARRADRGELGTLRIGYVGSVAYSGLPEIVRAFRERCPGVDARLHEMSPAMQIEALIANRLDVSFARGPVDEPALDVQTVLDEALVAALPSGHPLSARAQLGIAMLAREPFVVTARARGPGFHDHIISLCRSAGFVPRVVQEGSHFDVLSLVAAGTGVAIVPTSLREIRHGDVVYRPLRERPRAQLVMVSRKNATSPVLREFIDDVRRLGARGIQRGARKAK
jgi:DNA-binding transcriptional LysR family regulator